MHKTLPRDEIMTCFFRSMAEDSRFAGINVGIIYPGANLHRCRKSRVSIGKCSANGLFSTSVLVYRKVSHWKSRQLRQLRHHSMGKDHEFQDLSHWQVAKQIPLSQSPSRILKITRFMRIIPQFWWLLNVNHIYIYYTTGLWTSQAVFEWDDPPQ